MLYGQHWRHLYLVPVGREAAGSDDRRLHKDALAQGFIRLSIAEPHCTSEGLRSARVAQRCLAPSIFHTPFALLLSSCSHGLYMSICFRVPQL